MRGLKLNPRLERMGKTNPGKGRNLENEVAEESEFQSVKTEQAGEAILKGDKQQEESNITAGRRAWEEAAGMWGWEVMGEWVPRGKHGDHQETVHKNTACARVGQGE